MWDAASHPSKTIYRSHITGISLTTEAEMATHKVTSFLKGVREYVYPVLQSSAFLERYAPLCKHMCVRIGRRAVLVGRWVDGWKEGHAARLLARSIDAPRVGLRMPAAPTPSGDDSTPPTNTTTYGTGAC